MRKLNLRRFPAYAVIMLLVFQSCKDDSNLTESLPIEDQSYTESFDNFQEAYGKGWRGINRSTPVGRKLYDVAENPIITSPNYVAIYYPEWNQAQFTLDSLQFSFFAYPARYWESAYSSQRASNGYVATSLASAEFLNLTGPSVNYNVNNWLVSPEVVLQNGDKISFYTYCRGVARLQLWLNPTNSIEVGSDLGTTGDFSINLLDINPNYYDVATNPVRAFPQYWTRFEATVTGLSAPTRGRYAFRYIIQDGVPSGATSFDELYNEIHESVIGIDEVNYTSVR